jgi:hypothetical protein
MSRARPTREVVQKDGKQAILSLEKSCTFSVSLLLIGGGEQNQPLAHPKYAYHTLLIKRLEVAHGRELRK